MPIAVSAMGTVEYAEDVGTGYIEGSARGRGRAWWVIMTVGVAVLAFIIAGALPVSSEIAPVGVQGPLLMLTGALEAVAFGFGIAFLAFAWPRIKGMFAVSRPMAVGVYAGIGWLFLSPWIHDSIHAMTGHGLDAVIALGFVFHFGLVPFMAIIVYALFRLSAERRAAGRVPDGL